QGGRLLADQPLDELLSRLGPGEFYRLKIKGSLTSSQQAAFPNLTLEKEDEDTILSGRMESQTSLQATLAQLLQFDRNLLSVTCTEPNLEDVFMDLIDGNRKGTSNEHHPVGLV
ncbi:MAG TPA: hypothetical protein VFN35_20650, partial [Ktedonobacteraceae bacterium]|nr:hypothetical protein [Ktedonobacteraceae bacterium]